ncbi:hypothetical protein BDR04DRAFT_1130256 [Suillus decipiens]|nr:hypothetical protein BDR04DRAFT_1130256 [Suillus decipiens]
MIQSLDEPPLADDDDIVDYAIDTVHEPVYEPPDAPLHVPLDHDPQNELENPWQDPLQDVHQYLDVDDLFQSAWLPNLQRDMSFICSLQSATLDDGVGLKGEDLLCLQNPPRFLCQIDNLCEELAISLFLALQHSSEVAYDNIQNTVQKCYPDSEVPSLYRVKKLIHELMGISSIVNHQCINSCVAFVSPYAGLEMCPMCGKLRYDQKKLAHSRLSQCSHGHKKVPHAVFQTIPIGPQLQALCYRNERTQQIFEEIRQNEGYIDAYEDILTGSAYLDTVRQGRIKPEDMILMISINSTQLFESKIPKYIQLFLYPGFHHLAAIQREGLSIWDAWRDVVFISHPFLFLALMDGPGLICMSSLVGHTGKNGCHMYCDNYTVVSCTHEDINVRGLTGGTSALYVRNLHTLMVSQNQTQYKWNCLMTGIVGPSILLGLDVDHILGVPECFSSEIMHFSGANMASLFMDLWCGVADCHAVTDSVADWDWAFLKAVTATHTHLPGSFDVPPRNPAEKMHSFYKAHDIGPGLLYGILPLKYFQHYCKFYCITTAEMLEACICFSKWEEEFERIYYQCCVDQIHFVHPSVEGTRVGAPCCSSQWTLKQTIGDIEFDLCQPSNTMSNFTEICVMRCQVNPLKAMLTQFQTSDALHPQGSFDVGNGYFHHNNVDEFAEVLYFTQLAVEAVANEDDNDNEDNNEDDKDDEIPKLTWANVAIISQLLDLLHRTVWSCTHGGDEGLQLIDVRMITTVVAMILHHPTLPSGVMEDRYFMVKKTGLDVMLMGVEVEEDDQEEQEDQ